MKQFMTILGLVVICLLLSGGWSGPQTVQADSASERVARSQTQPAQNLDDVAEFEAFLDGFIEPNMEALEIPGLAFAMVKDGQLFFSKGYGFADIDNQIPVEPDKTVFRVGSVSKPVTAVAVMQLVEQGQLDLDTDINQYLSTVQIPNSYPEPVTIKQLLTHTAGFEDRIIGILAEQSANIEPIGEFLAGFPVERVYPPGTIHSYSNYSFTLAGQLVVEASGLPFNQYVVENLFQPLDMNASTFAQPVPQDLGSNVAIGYANTNPSFEAAPDIYMQIAPAGALSSTAEDMANFMIAMLADGRYEDVQIIAESTAQQMKQQQFTQHPELPGMTLGFKERYINNERLIGHSGDIDGAFASQLIMLPDHDIGFFLVHNSFNDALRQNFITAFMDQYFPATTTPPPPTAIDLTSDELARFAGSYRWVKHAQSTLAKFATFAPGADNWTVSVNDDATISLAPFALGAEWRYVPVEPLVFKQVSGEPLMIAGVQITPGDTLVFLENDAGEITFAFIPLQNAGLQKLAWYEGSAIQYGILGLVLLSFLSVLIWPVGSLFNRFRKQKTATAASPASRRARWLAGIIATTNLIALILLMTNLGPILGFGVPFMIKVALSLFVLTAILSLGLLVACVMTWMNRYWTVSGRIHYTALTLFAVLFVWWLNYWNLLGWHY